MGKQSKIFNLDDDVVASLAKEENRSQLVNSLLRSHYANDLTEGELKAAETKTKEEMVKLQTKLDYIQKQLKEYSENPTKGMIIRRY